MGIINRQRFIMKSVFIIAVVVLACVSGQRPRKPLKCGDGSKPTCTCPNGDIITRPRRNPCGDRTVPTCVCDDGSSPSKQSPCRDGNRPTCGNGAVPVCQDGSPVKYSVPPCPAGNNPPKCEDGSALICADGTFLPPGISNLIG